MISALAGLESNSDFASLQRGPHHHCEEVQQAVSPKILGVDNFDCSLNVIVTAKLGTLI